MELLWLAAGGLLFGLGLVSYLALAWRRSGLTLSQAARSFLSTPAFANRLDRRRAGLLTALILPLTAATLIVGPIMALAARYPNGLTYVVMGLYAVDVNLAIYVLARRGRGRLAAWLFPAWGFSVISFTLPVSHAQVVLAAYPIIIVIAGLLLGWRGALFYAGLSSLVGLVLLVNPGLAWLGAGASLAWPALPGYIAIDGLTALIVGLLAGRLEASIQHIEELQGAEVARSQELDRALRQESKRAQQQELLADCARHLTGISDPQTLIDAAARCVVDGLKFGHAAVYLAQGDQLVVHATRGFLSAGRPLGLTVALGAGRVGAAGQSGETSWGRETAPAADFAAASVAAIPLRFSQRVLGVLEVASTQPLELADVRTLEALADLASAGLQASQLFVQLDRRQQLTEGLRRIGAAVNQSLDLAQMAAFACSETALVFEADRVELWLLEGAAPERVAVNVRPGSPGDGDTAADLEWRGAWLRDRLAPGRASLLLEPHTTADPHGRANLGRSVIVAPLGREQLRLGFLALDEWHRGQPFMRAEASAAELLASQLTSAVANARLYAEDRHRASELAWLREIANTALEIDDYATLQARLANRLGSLLGAEGCVLAAWEPARQEVQVAAVSPDRPTVSAEAEARAAAAIRQLTEAALKAARPLAEPDAGASGNPAACLGAAVLSLPLIAHGQWLGAAHLIYPRPRQFSPDDLAYAEQAGLQIALALSKARALAAEQQRNTELEALHAASLRVSSSLDLPQVLETILQQALRLAGGQDAHIFLYDGERLSFGAARWADQAAREPFAAPRRDGLTDTVARTAQRIVVPDVNRHPLFSDWKWGGAIVGLPLRSGDRVCGVMNVAFRHPRLFDENELRLLELLADQAAVALENARLFNAEREQRALAEALHLASVALSSSLEFETVLDQLLDQIGRVVPFDAATIMLVEPTGSQTRVARSRGYEAPRPAAVAWLAAMAFDLKLAAHLRTMADSHQPLIVADTRADPAWSLGGASDQFHAWAGVPIVAHQQVMAFFTLEKVEVGFYQPEHAKRLTAFAGQAALALQNARLFEAERHRAAQLALLSDVSQQVTSTLDENLLRQRVVEAMVHRLGFAEAAILLPVLEDELEVVALSTSEPMAATTGFRQKVGAGVIGHAAEMGATYLTNDVGRDPYYFDPDGRLTGSAMALPLKYTDDRPAILYLETSRPGAFGAADVVAYETLANHITTALQNARLYEAARGRLRAMTALQAVSQMIVSSLELGDIFKTVVGLLHEHFGYAYVSLFELDGERLHLKAQVGYPDELILWDMPIRTGLTGRAARTRQTQFVPDIRLDPDVLQILDHVQSEICIPLLMDPDVLGVLDVESAPGQVLTVADVSLLSTLASQVTVAVQNARLFEAEREQRELAEALREASVVLSASLDYDTVLDRLLEQIGRVVPFEAAAVLLVDGARARVARLRGYEQFGPEVTRAAARLIFDVLDVPYLERMVRTGQPVIAADTTQDPDWVRVASSTHVRSWAGAPISAQGQVLAFFSLDHGQAGFYQPRHGARLAAFAGQAALALENARLFAAQRRRAEEQRLLLSAARDFSAALSEEAVLRAIVRHMTQALEAASCTVSQWDRASDAVLTLHDYLPISGTTPDRRGATYALAEYPATRWVLLTRQPLVVEVADPAADLAERELLEKNHQARMLMMPLYTGDAVFGLVEVQRGPDSAPFRETDQQLALSLATQAAVALENAQLHTAVTDNVRELDALLKANEALLSTLDLDLLLHNILAAASAAVPTAEMGTIALYDPDSQQLRVRAAHGYQDPRVQGIIFAMDKGYAAQAMRENKPQLIADVGQQPRLAMSVDITEVQAVASAIVAPLVPKRPLAAAYGVISLDATRTNAFTLADLRILVAFANTAAVAIENARLHAEVQRLAVTDSLTELANPRAFEHALATEAYRADRYGYPLSLIIMDIDSFKQYNDLYGHLAGNERLKEIAAILRRAVRDPDLPVRYGGEEFALLLPHTDKAGAVALAERVRELAQAAAPSAGEARQPLAGYTLSLGVATLPADAGSAGQLLLAADNAELAAKRAGKNRVCAALPVGAEPGTAQ